MSLHAEVYRPDIPRPDYDTSMLLLPNEQGSALSDYHGDLGEYLANATGMRVLALSAPLVPIKHSLARAYAGPINAGYGALVSGTASKLNKIVSEEGVNQVVTAGHSAAGLFALAMVVSEQLPVSGSFVTDPPAIRHSTPIKAEFLEYGGYQLFTERHKPKDNLPLDPLPSNLPPVSKLLKRHIKELEGYSAIYRSTLGFETLHRIATQMPDVRVHAAFPEFTFVAKPAILQHLLTQSRAWRTGPDTMPFSIEIIEKTYHSTFSNHHFFSKLLQRALDKLTPA